MTDPITRQIVSKLYGDPDAGANTQAHLLAAARSGDLAQAIAAGQAAGDLMGTTASDLVYSDAAAALGAAFDAIKARLLDADPDLAAAVAQHRKALRRPAPGSGRDKMAVVSKAVAYLDQTPWPKVRVILDSSAIDLADRRSRAALRNALMGTPIAEAYKIAWQILDAAGQPY